jgi:hypothetical protein
MSEARKPDALLIRRYVSIQRLQDLTAKGAAIGVLDTETGAEITGVLLA